jgi:uncharacterized membrane protein YfcA
VNLTRHTRFSTTITYIVAVVASGVTFLLTLVLILEFEYPNLERLDSAAFHPVVIAMFFSAVLGAIFAALRPSHLLRLAVLSSSMFWGFFSVVVVCLKYNGQVDWVPLGQALLILCSAISGALMSRWASNRFRPRATTPARSGPHATNPGVKVR